MCSDDDTTMVLDPIAMWKSLLPAEVTRMVRLVGPAHSLKLETSRGKVADVLSTVAENPGAVEPMGVNVCRNLLLMVLS